MSLIVIIVFALVVILGLAFYSLLLSAAAAGIWEVVDERSTSDDQPGYDLAGETEDDN
jgi:hypothetical protein